MTVAACAVGRLGPSGPWVGFAPTLDDGYALVVGADEGDAAAAPADPDDLVALAIAYFAEELPEPPEAFAATHGDIGALVRHVAEARPMPPACASSPKRSTRSMTGSPRTSSSVASAGAWRATRSPSRASGGVLPRCSRS